MTVILFGIIRGLMMHVTLVEIIVHDDKVEQFIDVFGRIIWAQLKSRGNLRFDVLQDRRCLRDFIFIEAYVDEQAVLSQDNATLQNCVEQLEPLMTGPRTKSFMGLMQQGARRGRLPD